MPEIIKAQKNNKIDVLDEVSIMKYLNLNLNNFKNEQAFNNLKYTKSYN